MHRLPRALTLRQTAPLLRRPQPVQHLIKPRTQARQKSEQIYYHASGEPMRLRTVRFKNHSFFSRRRIISFVVYSATAYFAGRLAWRSLDIEIEVIEDEEEDAEEVEEEEVEGGVVDDGLAYYADESSYFFPLTWSTPLPRTFYRGSDPEWQTFVAIAKDTARQKRIHDQLLQGVFKGASQHPTIAQHLGKNAKIGKYWLDISFPDGPPQEFERTGIEVNLEDGYIAWAQQKIDKDKQGRSVRVLWPQAVFRSFWASAKMFTGIKWRKMKQAAGYEDVNPHSPEERFKHAVEMMAKMEAQKNGGQRKPQTDPNNTNTTASSQSGVSMSSNTDSTRERPRLPFIPFDVPIPSFTSTSDLSDPRSTSDLPIAIHVFRSTLAQAWTQAEPQKKNPAGGIAPSNPAFPEPPRGGVLVQGIVEIRGDRGRVMMDVGGSFDPHAGSAGQFVRIVAGVRGAKMWKQQPKGGA